MSQDQIHSALDLGFSDYYDGENVRDITIQRHNKRFSQAVVLMQIEEAMCFSLFQTLGLGHPSPEIYVADFPSDARASFYLLLGGYYKQAILCLRNWLEVRLLGIYFGKVDRSKFDDWKMGKSTKRDALFGENILRKIFGRANFQKAEGRNGLRKRLVDLYGELSVFVHGQGVDKHHLQDDTDNVPRYNRNSVRLYLDYFERAWREVVYCTWLAYSDSALRTMNAKELATVLKVLPGPYSQDVQASLKKPHGRRR
jgi:hypothetical protein